MAAAEAINAITFNDAFTVIAGIAARLIEIAAGVAGGGRAFDAMLPPMQERNFGDIIDWRIAGRRRRRFLAMQLGVVFIEFEHCVEEVILAA